MDERVRTLLEQARGEKPVEADPTTGFHPDQLTSYPLQRVGPKLYTTHIEGVVPREDYRDRILVEVSEMGDYTHTTPSTSDFEDSKTRFTVRDERTPTEGMKSLTQQGKAVLTYTNIEDYLGDEDSNLSKEEYPNVVLEAGQERQEDMSTQDWRKLLDNSYTTLEILN